MSSSTAPHSPVLTYQLELLRSEIEIVNATIRQGDEITKNIKQWTITVWAASLGGALSNEALRPYAWATGTVPLLFWMVDTWHRAGQRLFIWRGLRIMDFLNDGGLARSLQEGKLVDFVLLDIGSRRDRSAELQRFTDWRRVLMSQTLSILYIGLSLISVGAWAMFVVAR